MIWASIDVGIKNCSICIFSSSSKSDYKIVFWENINLGNKILKKECDGVQKSGKKCTNNAIYFKNSEKYCKVHTKQLNLKVATKEHKSSYLNKQTIDNIKKISLQLNLDNTLIKKQQIDNIIQFIETNYYKTENSKQDSLSLVEIGKNIVKEFDKIVQPIDLVIIENQIGPLAIRMKTLQGMISQYFIMRNENIKIDYVSSQNKLKEFSTTTEKSTYKDRKSKSIEICCNLLEEQPHSFKILFQNYKKKDDLADSFLQGIWYLRNKLY